MAAPKTKPKITCYPTADFKRQFEREARRRKLSYSKFALHLLGRGWNSYVAEQGLPKEGPSGHVAHRPERRQRPVSAVQIRPKKR